MEMNTEATDRQQEVNQAAEAMAAALQAILDDDAAWASEGLLDTANRALMRWHECAPAEDDCTTGRTPMDKAIKEIIDLRNQRDHWKAEADSTAEVVIELMKKHKKNHGGRELN